VSSIPAEQRASLLKTLSSWTVAKGDPPAIVFFGTADRLLIPAREFIKKYYDAGNRIELYTAEGLASSMSPGWAPELPGGTKRHCCGPTNF